MKPTRRRSHAPMRVCVSVHALRVARYPSRNTAKMPHGWVDVHYNETTKPRSLITSVCKQCCYHSSTAHGERDFLLIIEFSLCVTDVAAIDYT